MQKTDRDMECDQLIPVFADSSTITLVVSVAVALLTGLIVPFILRAVDKSSKKEEKTQELQTKAEQRLEEASQVALERRLGSLEKSFTDSLAAKTNELTQLGSRIKEAEDRLTALNNSFLKRLSGCQTQFVSMEVYKNDLSTQKYYYKLLYAMLQRQIKSMSEDDDGDE